VYYGGAVPNTSADLIFTGEAESDFFGVSVAGAGDLTGDGLDDVVVGASSNDEAAASAGKAYVLDAYRYVLESPNGAEVWPVGSTQTIRWLGRDLADLLLSTDGGATYVRLESRLGGETENEHQLLVPHTPTRFARIKLTPSDTALPGRDHSDSLFTIETSVALILFNVNARPGGGAELSWATSPAVGPQGIAGYRLYRSASGGRGQQLGPTLITDNYFVDPTASRGSTYRLAAVNGLGEELELGRGFLTPNIPLSAWPLPYAGGALSVSFAAVNSLGGSGGQVDVSLYDAAGRRIRTLESGVFAPGYHTTSWDGRDQEGRRVPGGMYFLNLRVEGQARQMKIIVVP
jgi:hypothetical protein